MSHPVSFALAAIMSDHEQPPRNEGADTGLPPTAPADEAAYEPLPPEGESAAQVLARLEAAARDTAKPNGPARFNEDKQLTIRQLLLVTLILATCLGVLRLLDPTIGAGIMGFVVLAGVVWNSVLNWPIPLFAQVIWFGLIIVYMIMCAAAFAHMHMN